KLGTMLAIADENALYLLEFLERKNLEKEIKKLIQQLKCTIKLDENPILKNIQSEIADYFDKKISAFKTPIRLTGSPFQQKTWEALRKIPHGETRSYLDTAKSINSPTAFRAVARANSTNHLAIIVPCHRVIN